ncbi:recombinase family protein [Azohydromonas aeria]|uniref:recombinase family protein n=1 Tax=Azohydromonas aeria TaxID=2590212 RepID=UPI0018DEF0FA|nr:recombinase family protein [Azohydromonas aeria]
MTLAFSYIRFSTPEQAKGRSQARQIEACEQYCREHGLQLAMGREYTFLDAGRSAYKGEHLDAKGELARFLALVDEGQIERGSTLIVESLDRLSRQDVWTAVSLLVQLLNKGIRVVTLADRREYTDPKDEQSLILSIFILSRAHEESSTKAKRLTDAFSKKRELAKTDKKPMGQVCPMWLKLTDDGTGYEPIPERVEAVRRAFELVIAGYGKHTVARMLNAEGVPTFKSVKGWGSSTVSHVVTNRAVLGEWQPFSRTLDPARKKRQPIGEPIKGYFPAVVSEAVFYEAQAAVAGRRVSQATKQSVKFNVWQGIGKCIHCGSAMHMVNKGKPPKGTTYIECSIGRKGLCESHRLIRLDHSEAVFRLMLARLDSMALVKDSGAKLARELKATEGRLLEQQEALAGYMEMARNRQSKAVAALMFEAEDKIAELEREQERLRGELAAEDAIGFDTFMQRLDLETYEGRYRANSLLKRLNVLVFAGREGFMVSEAGRMLFGVAYQNGKAGYRELSLWPKNRQLPDERLHVAALKVLMKAGPVHFVAPLEAGRAAYALEEERAQEWYDSLPDEGQSEPFYHHS